MPQVSFYFDFGSPNAFLCHRVIPAIEQRTGVTFDYVPLLLGGLFKLTGNQSPMVAFAGIKNKPDYDQIEMRRFIARHGITDFQFNPHFPINTLHLMRGAVGAQELGVFPAYIDAVIDAMWTRGLNMGQPAVFAEVLSAAGLPTDRILELSQSPAVKQRLLDNTNAAFEKGAFGIPTFLVGDELYFGKDRLRDVEEAITGGPVSPDAKAAREAANKKAVVDSYNLALSKRDIDGAIRYLSPTYKQHNPTVADGIEGWRAMVTYIRDHRPDFSIEIKRVLADGDFVVMHVLMKRDADERGSAVVEIFRLEDNKIVEHWDIIQPIPESPANPNTMF